MSQCSGQIEAQPTLEAAWQIDYSSEKLELRYPSIHPEDRSRVVKAIRTIEQRAKKGQSLEFTYLFTLARTYSTGGSVEPSIADHWDGVMMFRDGIIQRELAEWTRIDWDDDDGVWHEFVLACGKVQLPLSANAFEFACQEWDQSKLRVEIDGHLTNELTKPTVEQLERLVGAAYLLQLWRDSDDIFLPVEAVGLNIAGKRFGPGKAAGSRLVQSLRDMGILECTNPNYSQAKGIAKTHRLNPAREGLYSVK